MDNLDTDIYEYLNSAAALVRKLEKARDGRQRLYDEVARVEKHRDQVGKAMSDEISITIKKRREELNSSYKVQLQEADAVLKKAVDKKDAARTAGKKERIARETAGLRRVTAELEAEQKKALSSAEISGICGKRWFFHFFMPSSFVDFLMLISSMALITYIIPYLIMNFVKKVGQPWVQMLVYMIVGLIFVIEYMIIHMKVCIPKKDILEEINQRAVSIKENKKEIRSIQVGIMSDESEEYYHLDDYNYEIAKAEAVRDEIKRAMENALNNFDMVTKKVIADEIHMGYDEQLTEAEILLETKKGDLELAEKKVHSLNSRVMEEYAPRLGRENLTSEKIEGIRRVVDENNTISLAEAVNLYNGHVC